MGRKSKLSDHQKAGPDWLAIEGAYRAGQKSLREIAVDFGTASSTIKSRAKKFGWTQDAAETKRQIVSSRMAGVAQGVAQHAMCEIEAAATQDVADMELGLEGARAILRAAVESIGLQGVHETDNGKLELKIDPKDLKTLSDCVKINVETIRTIRELDKRTSGDSADPVTVNVIFAQAVR